MNGAGQTEHFTILLEADWFDRGIHLLEKRGDARLKWVRVDFDGSPPDEALLNKADCIVTRRDMTPAQFEAASRLKLIQVPVAGYETIDLKRARARGVWVCNNAGANAPSVAEHVFLLALALSRHFVYHRERATRGPWENRKYENRELRGRTLGIVGLGHCGKAVARRARAFGMRVCVNDIRALSPEECLQREVSPVSLRTLLGTSDIVSLHVPLTSKTRRMIRAETLSWMKPDSLLVNTSRGGVVCERDLVESLERGIPAAAALDVFEKEPLEETSPLKRMPNVIVTPHCGASRESVGRTLERILDNVTRVSRGSAPAGVAVDYEDFEDASAGS